MTFLNSNAEKLIGWTNAEASGKPLHEVFKIVNEETREQVESPVSKAIRQGAVVGLANHTLLIAKDGRERPIDDGAAPIRFESSGRSGPLLGVVMVFHDITERRRAEQRLENSEVRYRRLFEAAHDGILILEADECRITDVNPFIMKLLDYPRQHFIGKELWEIGVFKDKEASQKAMRELREKGWLRYENLALEDRDGRRHPVGWSPTFTSKTIRQSSSATFGTSVCARNSSASATSCWQTNRLPEWRPRLPTGRRMFSWPPSVTRCARPSTPSSAGPAFEE